MYDALSPFVHSQSSLKGSVLSNPIQNLLIPYWVLVMPSAKIVSISSLAAWLTTLAKDAAPPSYSSHFALA